MDDKNNQNRKQDIDIVVISQKVETMRERFDRFVASDFENLRIDVREIKSWLFYGCIALIAITILTQVVLKLFV